MKDESATDVEATGPAGHDMDLSFDPMEAARAFESRQHDRRGSAFASESSHPPITLGFKDVCFGVETKKEGLKTILNDINGLVAPGEVLAIMGSSGAGKTSLLNLLAGRLPSSQSHTKITGHVFVNEVPRKMDSFRSQSAYVLQEDRFFPELTVRETISFSASLRLPRSMSKEVKKQRVDSIIAELGLAKIEDVNVGNDFVRGVSGGERKRVNIGTELVTDPSLLFLDEPTRYVAQQWSPCRTHAVRFLLVINNGVLILESYKFHTVLGVRFHIWVGDVA